MRFIRLWQVVAVLIILQISGLIYLGQDKIVAYGLSCTCPDVEIVWGRPLLKAMVPDELKPYNLYTGEAWLTGDPEVINLSDRTPTHPYYIFSGKVTGKARVSEYDPWNPVIEMDVLYLIQDADVFVFEMFFYLEAGLLLILIIIGVYKKIRGRMKKRMAVEAFE